LGRARSNLAQAKAEAPGIYLEDLCFDAQQAAEKAIKAVLLHRGVGFPYIHDLAELLRLLEQAGQQIPPEVRVAGDLGQYATETRYPSTSEPVGREEYREALAIAEAVVRWAEERLEQEI
jgi:HEPN domain-containing protein